jgi:hypothetical protein
MLKVVFAAPGEELKFKLEALNNLRKGFQTFDPFRNHFISNSISWDNSNMVRSFDELPRKFTLKIPPDLPLPASSRKKTPKGGIIISPFTKGGRGNSQ